MSSSSARSAGAVACTSASSSCSPPRLADSIMRARRCLVCSVRRRSCMSRASGMCWPCAPISNTVSPGRNAFTLASIAARAPASGSSCVRARRAASSRSWSWYFSGRCKISWTPCASSACPARAHPWLEMPAAALRSASLSMSLVRR